MFANHFSKSAARAPEIKEGDFASNRLKTSHINKWLSVLLCFIFVFSLVAIAVPQAVHAAGEGYSLDRVITWADGTTERVQIGNNGFIAINGVGRWFIGMVFTGGMPYGAWYSSANLALYDKELAYLESVGIRFVYVGWFPQFSSIQDEASAYGNLFDLFYKHKMMVLPLFSLKNSNCEFKDLANPNFSWARPGGGIDTAGDWATRWINIVSRYQNVVALIMESEINYPLPASQLSNLGCTNPVGQNYGALQAANYLSFIKGIFRSKTELPISTTLLGNSKMHPELMAATLATSDFLSFTDYALSITEMDQQLDLLSGWKNSVGKPTVGWWNIELNNGYPPNVNDFNVQYIESLFAHGAGIVTLFAANATRNPTWQFFDNNGNPVPKLVEIAKEIPRLQAPIYEKIVRLVATTSPPKVTSVNTSGVTTTSVVLSGNLDGIGTAATVNASFQWGTSSGSYSNETTVQAMSAPGGFTFALSSLTPGTTYYYRGKAAGDGTAYGNEKSFKTAVSAPVVITTATANLTDSSATLSGNLSNLGTASSVNISFQLGTNSGFYSNETTAQSMNSPGSFTFALGSLTPGATYYYRAKATGDGTVYGDEKTFRTSPISPSPPKITTNASGNLTNSSAVVSVNPEDMNASLQWPSRTSPISDIVTQPESASEVTTSEASKVNSTGATLNGNLSNLGTASSVNISFQWGTSSGSYSNETTVQAMSAPGGFTFALSSLTPGTTYYYRGKAAGDGTAYGNEKSFKTAVSAPVVITTATANLTDSSATLSGNLSNLGTASSVNISFQLGTNSGFYSNETTAQSMNSPGSFTFALGSLTPGATYYYRAKATGDGTVYGDEKTFRTSPISPSPPKITTNASGNLTNSSAVVSVNPEDMNASLQWPSRTSPISDIVTQPESASEVTTSEASKVNSTGATLNGNLSNLGTASSVNVSFQWGTSSGSYSNETTVQAMSAPGGFTFALSSLTPGATYYYRAKAAADGTAIGVEKNFKTPVSMPVVTANETSSANTAGGRR